LVRNKKHRNRAWKRWLIFFAVIVLIVLGAILGPQLYDSVWIWWTCSGHFPLQNIIVEGNHCLSTDSVLALASIPSGISLVALDLTPVEIGLELHPWLEQVYLYRRLPSTLVIHVREIEPILLVSGDRMGVVGSNGEYLGPIWSGITWDLPMLAGVTPLGITSGSTLFGLKSEDIKAIVKCAVEAHSQVPEVFRAISDFYLKDDQIYMNLVDGISEVTVSKDASETNWKALKEFLLGKRNMDFSKQKVIIDLRFPEWVIVAPDSNKVTSPIPVVAVAVTPQAIPVSTPTKPIVKPKTGKSSHRHPASGR